MFLLFVMNTLNDIPAVSGREKDVKKFGDDSFWRDRYSLAAGGAQTFEWFVSLADAMEQSPTLKSIFQSRLSSGKCRILEVGCGTSSVCECLWDMGFRDLTGLDNQPDVVAFCDKRQKERKIRYVVGDMTKLPFEDGTFDVLIDKGALDVLVCRGGDDLTKTGKEIWRVLKPSPTSVLVCLTNSPLTEIPDGLQTWFDRSHMQLIKNNALGQFMAKLYLFGRKKKPLK